MSLRETYQACKTLMVDILSSKGISANNQMGLTTLINKIRQLPSLDKTTVLSINVPLNLTYSDDFNISGTLLWDNIAVANKTVSLKVGNTIVDTATTNNYGEYSFTTSPVSMGTHSFQVVFDGDSSYDASESSVVTREIERETSVISITSNHNTGYNPSDVINVAGLLVSDDAEAISGASVKIYDSENTLIDTLTTDNTGAFSTTINGADLNTGDNLFNIVFDGDNYYTASSTSLTLRISVASTMTVGLYDTNDVAIDTVSLHGQNSTGIIKAVVYDQLGNVMVGETVNFNVDGVISSAVTDNTGVAEYTYTAQSVAGTGEVSVMVSCDSLIETCNFYDVFYTNKLDSNTQFYQITGTTTCSDGIMGGGSAYLSDGWDNTKDYVLSLDFKYTSNDGNAIYLLVPTDKTERDKEQIIIYPPYAHKVEAQGTVRNSVILPSISTNTWYTIKLQKIGNNLTVIFNEVSYSLDWDILSNYSQITCGVDTWGSTAYIRNVKVIEL